MKNMWKMISFCFLVICLFGFVSVSVVEAKEVSNIMPLATNNASGSTNEEGGINLDPGTGNKVGSNCNAIFNAEAESLIVDLLTVIQILGPIILILMTALDFAKAVISQDDKAFSKAGNSVLYRCIATIGLFLVPTFVKILFNIEGVRSILEDSGIVNNPTCT